MPKAIADNEMLNKKFGRWTVLSKIDTLPGEKRKWLCQCECGVIRAVEGSSLRTGRSQSCGCLAKERNTTNLKNQIFGDLLVLEATDERRDGSVVWKCQCSCGNQCYVDSHNLQRGSTKSCGHLIGKNLSLAAKDIAGQRFGKLVALFPTEERKYRSVVWACKCDCGNDINASLHNLQEGKVKSCGCLKSSYGELKIEKLLNSANIPFVKEQKFASLGQYRFDFYVNNHYLIEFDGKQHFTADDSGWFNEEIVLQIKERDAIKDNWCKNNNIPLIRIPYYVLETFTLEDLILEKTKYRVV